MPVLAPTDRFRAAVDPPADLTTGTDDGLGLPNEPLDFPLGPTGPTVSGSDDPVASVPDDAPAATTGAVIGANPSTDPDSAPVTSGSPLAAPGSESALDQVRNAHAVIKPGASGAAVAEIQTRLTQCGFKVPVTSQYDRATVLAVKQLQNALGTGVDGSFGPGALDALERAEAIAASFQDRTTGIAWRKGQKLGPIEVVTIDNHQVEIKTAYVVTRMKQDSADAGAPLVVVSGFRTFEKQAELYRLYQAGKGNLAAPPGRSNHEDGVAIDWNAAQQSSAQYKWLAKNGESYGFIRTVSSEPWHWEYRPQIS
jgi:hypothetical protein